MNLEEGDFVLCTVDRIEKTIVFVKIHLNDKEIEGSVITSEIAPGRIRNIRDYVVPKKKIVCKVLRILKNGNVELSLRRVTLKETKEVLEKYEQERSYVSILKSITGKDADKVMEKILAVGGIYDFLEQAKENPKSLEELAGKENAKKILDILGAQKEKVSSLKRVINLKTTAPNGLESIKKFFQDIKGVEIKYTSAGKYSMISEANNLKNADKKIKETAEEFEKRAKLLGLEFSITER